VPPLIPLVAVVSLLVGLGIGFRLAPDRDSSATPSQTYVTAPPNGDGFQGWYTAPPGEVATIPPLVDDSGFPPNDGLSLEEALAALTDVGFSGPPALVISARVARYGEVGWDSSHPANDWVWVFVVRSDFTPVTDAGCGTLAVSPTPSPSPSPSLSPSPSATDAPSAPTTDGAATDPCIVQGTATVILDYRSGQMIEAQITAPVH
jgi:hypothetical protein